MLNNREIAVLLWLGVATLWLLFQPKQRSGLCGVLKLFLQIFCAPVLPPSSDGMDSSTDIDGIDVPKSVEYASKRRSRRLAVDASRHHHPTLGRHHHPTLGDVRMDWP